MRFCLLPCAALIFAAPARTEDLVFKIPPVKTSFDVKDQAVKITVWGTVSSGTQGLFKLALTADLSDLQGNIGALLASELNRSDRCGERLSVEWQKSPKRGIWTHGDRLMVRAQDSGSAREKLQEWLKQAAEERLAPRLLQLARDLGYPVKRVVIRCQRTRWGSCSTRGTVSLNCSLVFLEPDVVRYLFVHELAHTQHMNHSPAFWRLVESLEPDYRRLDRQLLAGWRTVPLWVFGT